MRNISRTTLRELKKRYLNILKKCFLANLMAFGMVTLSTPATAGEDRLDNSGDKTYTQDVTFEDLEYSGDGGAISNAGSITFGGSLTATFTGNSASRYGGAIYNNRGAITFVGDATFTGNKATNHGGAIYNDRGTITFGEGSTATFTNNSASSSGGAIDNDHGTITFGGDAIFTGNSGGGTATIYASALLENIKVSMPSCALCTYKDSIGAMHHCTCNFVPNIAIDFDMGDLCGLIAPRKLIVVSGGQQGIELACKVFCNEGDVVLCDDEQLYSRTLTAKSVNFIPFDTLTAPMRVEAKIRYAHKAAPATVYPTEESTVRVEFDQPQRAISKGQSVVLYDGDIVIGGGIID